MSIEFWITNTEIAAAAAKSLQSCPTLCDPIDSSLEAPLSLGFSRQEHWSGLPFPSPMHESEKWKGSRSVVSDSSRPHGLQPTRLLHPWDFPGKSTGVGCHRLLQIQRLSVLKRKYNSSTEVWEKGRKMERPREKTRTHGRCVITGEECYYRHMDSLEISLNLHGAIRRSLFVSCAVDSAYSHGSRFIEQWLANTLTNNTKFSHNIRHLTKLSQFTIFQSI